MTPTIADIEAARARLAGVARETPLYPSETFSRLAGRQVLLKAENLQRTGSFKIRGAYNTIATLGETERRAGVVAASAGNHGQAVAWAAREAGIAATIFMPQDAPMAKVEATRSYGGRTELTGEGFEERSRRRAGSRRPHRSDARARVRGRARDRRAGDDRPRAGRAGTGRRDRAHPDRRRRARRGDRARAEGAQARRARDRRRSASPATRSPTASR